MPRGGKPGTHIYPRNRFKGRPMRRRINPETGKRIYYYKPGVKPGPDPLPKAEKARRRRERYRKKRLEEVGGIEGVELKIEKRKGKRPKIVAKDKKNGKDVTHLFKRGELRKQMNESMEELLAMIPLDDMEANLIANYGNPYKTAAALGISWVTVYRYLKNFPQLRMAQELGKEAMVDYAEAKNLEAMEKGVNANVIWTLRTLGKKRGWNWDKEEQKTGVRKVKVIAPHQDPDIQDVEAEDVDGGGKE